MSVSEILRRGAGGTGNRPVTRPTSDALAGSGGGGGSGGAPPDQDTAQVEKLIRGGAEGCEQVDLKQDLLIRLFGGNFVSIEASACRDLLRVRGAFRSSGANATLQDEAGQQQIKLCLVDDWRGARILEANGSQLWPARSSLSSSPPRENNFAIEQNHLNESSRAQQAAPLGLAQADRLAFASAASVISLLGILANLLILAIIVINTKQKLPNFLSRGSQTSNTNYHFVLLFQLTLTGLLICSCTLLSTTSQLRHQHDYSGAASEPSAATASFYPTSDEPAFNYQSVTWSQWPFSAYSDGQQLAEAFLQDPVAETKPSGHRQMALLISLESDSEQVLEVGMASTEDLLQRKKQALKVVRVERLNATARPNQPRPRPFQLGRVFLGLIAAIYIWTVAGLAFDRYCAIAYPLEYLRALSSSRARSFLLVLWLSALLLLVLMPAGVNLLGDERPDESQWPSSTASDDHSEWASRGSDPLSARLLSRCGGSPQQTIVHDGGGHQQTEKLLQTLLAIWGADEGQPPAPPQAPANQPLRVSLSLVTFLLVVVAPLAIATICNLSIYGIVKGHERRMSASSSSQQAAGSGGCLQGGGSINGANSFASSLRQNWWLFKRDGSFSSSSIAPDQPQAGHQHAHKHHHACDTCSAYSVSSSIFGKLVRASQQVGASLACRQAALARRSSSTWSSGSSRSSSSEPAGRPDQEARQRLLEHRPDCEAGGARRRDLSAQSSSGDSLMRRRDREQPLCGHRPRPASQMDLVAAAKRKLKRKLSDKDELEESAATCYAGAAHRNRSLLSQRSFDSFGSYRAGCGCQAAASRPSWTQQLNGSSTCATKQSPTSLGSQLDSDGIMRQLKLAGLSFAGIPINELMQTGGPARRPLNRSSSCSLGNLNTLQLGGGGGQPADCGSSRYSCLWNAARTSNKFQTHFKPSHHHQPEKKSSLVSLDQTTSGGGKCHTQLLADRMDSLESIAMAAGGDARQQRALFGYAKLCGNLPGGGATGAHMGAANQNRVQFNVVFNVVVWLILLLLACSIPQYSLQMMLELASFAPVPRGSGSLGELLDGFLQESADCSSRTRSRPPAQTDAPIRVGLLILTRLCDLLFLLTLPLNAWLYGIRSRSLKATLNMMLRKYISKRQATIEIDQRRKSVMLQRSRDSSIVGLIGGAPEAGQQPICACHHHHHHHHNHHQHQPRNCYQQRRVVRRCASFNLPANCLPNRPHHFDEKQQPDFGQNNGPKLERTLSTSSATEPAQGTVKPSHANSIRFVLGDEQQLASSPPPPLSDQFPFEAPNLRQGLLDCLLASGLSCQPLKTSASLNSTPTTSDRSLLAASIQSSHSAALLLLNGTALNDEPLRSLGAGAKATHLEAAQPLAGVLKNGQRQVVRRRQESCESAGFGSSGGDSPGGRHSILARVQSSPGELAVAWARARGQLKCEPTINKCHFQGAQFEVLPPGEHQRETNASKIKLLLTSADDETSTREPLVGGADEQQQQPGETKLATDDEFCGMATMVPMETPSQSDSRTEPGARQRANFGPASSRQSADYCRQVREAIARYFARSRGRRRLGSSNKQRRRRLNQAARCSCEPKRFHRKSQPNESQRSFQPPEIEIARRPAESGPIVCRLKPSHSTGSFLQTEASGRPADGKRPPVHLKPPSSLKLINLERLLTGGPTPAVYTSLLALSPIKECSSNHSCASSLSSLNNAFGQPAAQQQS